MKLGLFSLMIQPDAATTPRQVLENTRLMVEGAEQAGFDTAWFAEHHFTNYSICPSPLMMASYAAGFTSRIKLGTAVIVLPFYHILRVIEEIGLLDVQSNGRAMIGLGYGYQQHEFDRFGRHSKDKVEIALEAFDIIDQAMATGEVAFKGKHYDIPKCQLSIRPMHVPDIYVTGLEPVILQRIAKSGYTPYYSYGNAGIDFAISTRKHIDNQYRHSWRRSGEVAALRQSQRLRHRGQGAGAAGNRGRARDRPDRQCHALGTTSRSMATS